MSRKVKKIFNKLKSSITTPELLEREFTIDYEIQLGDYRDWLINSKFVHSVECLPHKHISLIEYSTNFYIVIPDISSSTNPFCTNVLTDIFSDTLLLKEQPGIKSFIWSQLDFYQLHSTNQDDLYLKIFSQPKNNEFEISDLEEFLIPFEIYKLDSTNISSQLQDQEFLNQLCYKIYGLFLCENHNLLSLKFNDVDTLTNIKFIFELYGDLISIPIFRGLTSTNWDHFFLEFYRCIERLYGYPVIKSFIESINPTNSPTLDFDLLIKQNEQHYNVKPNEENALISLLKHQECSSSITEFALNYSITSTENKVEKIAKRIYKRRNSIAHWRKALDDETLKVDELLIKNISSFIISLYQIYSPYLSK